MAGSEPVASALGISFESDLLAQTIAIQNRFLRHFYPRSENESARAYAHAMEIHHMSCLSQ